MLESKKTGRDLGLNICDSTIHGQHIGGSPDQDEIFSFQALADTQIYVSQDQQVHSIDHMSDQFQF